LGCRSAASSRPIDKDDFDLKGAGWSCACLPRAKTGPNIMKYGSIPFALLVLALAGCAGTAPTQVASAATPAPAASAPAPKCHRESRVGTNLYQTVCEASQSDREDNLEGVNRLLGPQAAGPGYSTGH
jgi:hypothetical protein